MRRRSLGLAAVIAAVAATPALAAPVTVRVEGASDTLVARTALTTTTTPVNKDGVAGHECTGTSAAGALDQASGGDWSGAWSSGLGYSVNAVKGESHTFGSGQFWGFFVNDHLAASGICGVELQTGDSVLLAPIAETATSFGVLSVSDVPATAAPGQPFTVRVTRTTSDFVGAVTRQPAAGATVTGGGVSATTGTDGSARIILDARGPASLRASSGGDIRSASESVCVTDGSDGACGSSAASACATSGDDGLCGTKDRRAPRGRIASIREGQRFGKGKGPRSLSGSVAADPSGIAEVRLRLTRNDHGRCQTFDGRSERLVALKRCGAKRGKWFSAGDREQWSYLLPARLGPGRYVLDVQVRDRAGNVDTLLQRTRTRVVFIVS
jgi:hypothetical protein